MKEFETQSDFKLELWVHCEDKIVSFREIADWEHHIYASESEMLSRLDQMTAQGFRFQ